MQYFGAAGQIAAGGNTTTIATTASITDGLKSTIALMCANTSFAVRPTAIYANPVLLDLLDREMKAEFNVVMNTKEIAAGFTVKMLVTQAGELPLIPDWSLAYTGTPGTGTNPEQLFAVGWSACFLSAIKIVAARMKVRLPADLAIDPEVDLGTTGGGYLLQARLNVNLPGIAPEVAQALVDGAHLECPYSKATHGNINVVTNIVTNPAAHVA